jgi:hypothetical protein
MNGLGRLVPAGGAAEAGLAGRVAGIEMLAVQALEDVAVDDAARAQAEFGDSLAGPGAGRLAALLGWGQVVTDALSVPRG